MKKFKKIIAIFCLLILYCYFINISNFPSSIITYNENLSNYKLCPFLNLKGETLVSASGNNSNYKLSLSLGNIDVKTVDLTVLEKTYLVPIGQMVGIKLYIDGVMIVGFSEIENIYGEIESIADNSNLEEGDRIIKINDKNIYNIEDLRNEINNMNGEALKIVVENIDGELKEETVTPIKTGENEYKIGLWVKEGATGVGTISFYDPETMKFAALGHGIVDSDTGELLTIESGELTETEIISLTKGISRKSTEKLKEQLMIIVLLEK